MENTYIKFTIEQVEKASFQDFSIHLKDLTEVELNQLYRKYRRDISKMTLYEPDFLNKMAFLEGYLTKKFVKKEGK